MTFTDKDYEDALRLRKVTELAKPTLMYSDGAHFPSGSSAGSYTINTPPKYAGGYRMGDEADGGRILFSLPKKPRWIHRMGVRLVLGWVWVDA